MRLAVVITDTGVGGAETQAVRVSREFARRGAAVGLLSMLPPGPLAAGLDDAGVEVQTLGLQRGQATLNAFWQGAHILKRWRCDVVLSFLYHANILARLTRPIARPRVLVSSVRTEVFGGRGRELALRATDPLSEATVTNSDTVARSLVQRRIVPSKKIVVIPNAVNPADLGEQPRHRASVREQLALGDHFVWLAVGRVEPRKDHATLMRALSFLPAGPRPRALLVVGSVTHETVVALQAIAGEGTRSVFLGECLDIERYYSAADAFVHTSRNESMPNALLEAMAHRLPVVVTQAGGVAEVVREGVSGCLVNPGDTQGLAASMLRIEELGGAERIEMGERSSRLIADRFDLQAAVDKWLSLFERLLGGHSGRH